VEENKYGDADFLQSRTISSEECQLHDVDLFPMLTAETEVCWRFTRESGTRRRAREARQRGQRSTLAPIQWETSKSKTHEADPTLYAAPACPWSSPFLVFLAHA
jgi:hypothetical protein